MTGSLSGVTSSKLSKGAVLTTWTNKPRADLISLSVNGWKKNLLRDSKSSQPLEVRPPPHSTMCDSLLGMRVCNSSTQCRLREETWLRLTTVAINVEWGMPSIRRAMLIWRWEIWVLGTLVAVPWGRNIQWTELIITETQKKRLPPALTSPNINRWTHPTRRVFLIHGFPSKQLSTTTLPPSEVHPQVVLRVTHILMSVWNSLRCNDPTFTRWPSDMDS